MDYHLKQLSSNAPVFAQVDTNSVAQIVARMKTYIDYKQGVKSVSKIDSIIPPMRQYNQVGVKPHINTMQMYPKHLYGNRTPLDKY